MYEHRQVVITANLFPNIVEQEELAQLDILQQRTTGSHHGCRLGVDGDAVITLSSFRGLWQNCSGS